MARSGATDVPATAPHAALTHGIYRKRREVGEALEAALRDRVAARAQAFATRMDTQGSSRW
jgi:hypothetical protein